MIKNEELLSVDRKYLNHRGRKAAVLAKITKDYADSMNRVPATDEGAITVLNSTIDALSRLKDVFSDQGVQEADKHSDLQGMSFEDAIYALLRDGKKIRRHGWFGKLLFRNSGELGDGTLDHPVAMALKLVMDWRDVAEIETNDLWTCLNNDDMKAHDWEIVDCKLPWEG